MEKIQLKEKVSREMTVLFKSIHPPFILLQDFDWFQTSTCLWLDCEDCQNLPDTKPRNTQDSWFPEATTYLPDDKNCQSKP